MHKIRVLVMALAVCMAVGAVLSGSAWAASSPEATVLPAVTPAVPHQGRPETGTTGSWSGGPTTLSYQWRRCNAGGSECTSIAGATSAIYSPVEADVGHTLDLQVTATNGSGPGSAVSNHTSLLQALGQITEYNPLKAGSTGIVNGPDGNLWLTGGTSVDIVTTGGTLLNSYSLGTGASVSGIANGPDGHLWVAETGLGRLARVSTTGTIQEYALSANGEPWEVTVGADHNLWVTQRATSRIAKVTTSGVVTEFALAAGSDPYGITSGPGESLWFASNGSSSIGKISLTGSVTQYGLPAGSDPYGITVGGDGNVWFTERGTSRIGKITSGGVVSEYALPAGSEPTAIASDPGGNLWFVDRGSHKIGRITTGGAITEYAAGITFVGGALDALTIGPDGNAWFTSSSKIGNAAT